MKFTYTCKKVSLNDSVKAYAEKKVGKLEKFFKEEPEASVTFSVEKKNRCVAEIMLRGANGTLFRAHARTCCFHPESGRSVRCRPLGDNP